MPLASPAHAPLVPELDTVAWLNTDRALRLGDLRGRPILLHAFQMLCPACVSHGLPQASAAHERFARHGLSVLGLHTVFEHHAAMAAPALRAFVHEYRLRFPIGIDRALADGPVPASMRALRLQGTPSLLLIDAAGRIRMQRFGLVDDLELGAAIGRLLWEAENPPPVPVWPPAAAAAGAGEACSASGCPVPGTGRGAEA